jgi:glycosyltransferase involved in cell wall biosynthesis
VNSVVHLTSVHIRTDTRVFIRACSSLAKAGWRTSLVVADCIGDEQRNGVNIYDVGVKKWRFDRIFNATRHVYAKALELDANIYHLHDPELIPIGLKLKRAGKIVIFDSHEYVPKQLIHKPYLNKFALTVISSIYSLLENIACKRFDGIITATPYIRDKFLHINPHTIDINNFPVLDELTTDASWENKRCEVCYIGGISTVRGIQEIIAALELVKTGVRFNLCGKFDEPDVEAAVKASKGWERVNDHGFVGRAEVKTVLSHSMAGLVVLYPIPNHVISQPNKMFEYMSADIPVIASDFPHWREIITSNQCGLLVDPLNPKKIAEAIDYLVMHPDEARRMGENGRKAVVERYNWQTEEQKLLAFYDELLRSRC